MWNAARRGALAGIVTALLAACGASQESAEEPTTEGAEATGDVTEAVAPTLPPRALLRSATFGKLVSMARQLEEDAQGDSKAGCLIRPPDGAGGFRLDADLAAAIRPLPNPPDDLDARLESSLDEIRPLTQWGQVGEAREGMLIGAFTALPPVHDVEAVIFVLTDRGLYVRYGDRAVDEGARAPAPVDTARDVARRHVARGKMVFVTAEAGVRVRDVSLVLAAVPAFAPVALAVPLPESTTLPPGTGPREATPEDSDDGRCGDGLPPLAEGVTPGRLPSEAIRTGMEPLTGGASRCLESSGAGGGGRVVIAFRVAPDGTVSDACSPLDQTGSAALRRCLLDAIRTARFPEPSPSGPVTVEQPLVLRYRHQQALCGESR